MLKLNTEQWQNLFAIAIYQYFIIIPQQRWWLALPLCVYRGVSQGNLRRCIICEYFKYSEWHCALWTCLVWKHNFHQWKSSFSEICEDVCQFNVWKKRCQSAYFPNVPANVECYILWFLYAIYLVSLLQSIRIITMAIVLTTQKSIYIKNNINDWWA